MGPPSLRHSRQQGEPQARRPDGPNLHGRVRPLNLLPRPGKQCASRIVKGEGSPAPRRRRRRTHYTRTKGRTAFDGSTATGLRSFTGTRRREGPHQLLGVLPLPAEHLSADRAHRHRPRQFQPTSIDEEGPTRRLVCGRQQRRVRLCADQRRLAQPHRGAQFQASPLRPRPHQPPLTRRAALDAQSLHRLAWVATHRTSTYVT